MRPRKLVAAPPLNGNGEPGPGKPGRPRTKRNPEIVAAILDGVRAGAPYTLACAAAGVSCDSFSNWRRADPDFALEVEQAAAQGALSRLKKIEQHGEENFAALSWMLERRFPEYFARPEIQLSVGIQNNIGANGVNSFESVVLADLEYSRLREHPAYQHHKPEYPVRDIETTVSAVDPELSGHLSRQDHHGSIVSESQQRENERRSRQVEARINTLLEAKRAAGNANGNGAAPSDAMVPAAVTMPAGKPSVGWWAALSVGDGIRPISDEAAEYVIRMIAVEVLGAQRTSNLSIELEAGGTVLRDVWSALSDLTGTLGWNALVKRGER